MPDRLILCGGARRTGGGSMLRLALSGRSQNITLRLEDIRRRLVRNVPGLLIDLIEIAAYVYCADQAISRGGDVQRAMGADWRRTFRFVIPVRNPDHWNDAKVSEPLCAALSFLSEDEYAFEFEKATDPVLFQDYLELGDDGDTALRPMKSFCSLEVLTPSAELSRNYQRAQDGLRSSVTILQQKFLIIKSNSSQTLVSGSPSGSFICLFL
jgi:hypothetical protein